MWMNIMEKIYSYNMQVFQHLLTKGSLIYKPSFILTENKTNWNKKCKL